MNLMHWKLLFCIGLLYCISSCKSKEKEETKTTKTGQQARQQPPQKVDVIIVVPQKITESIEIPGTLVASESTDIHPEVSGRITYLNLREGAIVGRGSVIARIYDADLQAQLQKLQAQLNIANQTTNRLSQLLQIQGISRQDYDLAVLNANS